MGRSMGEKAGEEEKLMRKKKSSQQLSLPIAVKLSPSKPHQEADGRYWGVWFVQGSKHFQPRIREGGARPALKGGVLGVLGAKEPPDPARVLPRASNCGEGLPNNSPAAPNVRPAWPATWHRIHRGYVQGDHCSIHPHAHDFSRA